MPFGSVHFGSVISMHGFNYAGKPGFSILAGPTICPVVVRTDSVRNRGIRIRTDRMGPVSVNCLRSVLRERKKMRSSRNRPWMKIISESHTVNREIGPAKYACVIFYILLFFGAYMTNHGCFVRTTYLVLGINSFWQVCDESWHQQCMRYLKVAYGRKTTESWRIVTVVPILERRCPPTAP